MAIIGNGITTGAAGLDEMITVSDAQPTVPSNKVWVKETSSEIVIPTAEELSDVKNAISELDRQISELPTEIYTAWFSKNILLPDAIIKGGYISKNDGTISPSENYFYTDFIEIQPNTGYTFTCWTDDATRPNSARYISLCYTDGKEAISDSYINNAGIRSLTFTTPSNAKYVRVSSIVLPETAGVTYQIEKGSAYTSRTKYSKYIVFNDNSNVLLRKKWVACGDSFTHGDFTGSNANNELAYGKYAGENCVYPFIIGNRNNMEIVNEAVNGSTMSLNDGTHNAFSTVNGRYTQIPDDADYITLYFGINDANYSSPIGAIDDTDNTTFYGAWNVVLDYLMRHHPFAKIGVIVTNGAPMAYINAEKAVAAKWGIPYLDMNDIQTPVMNRSNNQSITNEVREFRTQVFSVSAPTNTHPSAKAHEYESTFIEAFLRRL